jgi:hypothetical protein
LASTRDGQGSAMLRILLIIVLILILIGGVGGYYGRGRR